MIRKTETAETHTKHISVIIPLFNEERNVAAIYEALTAMLSPLPYSYELIFVNDGSTDGSGNAINALAKKDRTVRHLEFSRNFGKEIAMTAGLQHAKGNAAILIDSDLQHPPEMIPEFIAKWEAGADVVVGIRNTSTSESWFRRFGSTWFYRIMNAIADTRIEPHSTDFRLLDRAVLNEFNTIAERNRITRGLIDWLGFTRVYVHFSARERNAGGPTYSTLRLAKLALTGFITHSLFPLRFAGYAGVFTMLGAGSLGLVMLADRYFTWGFNFSGPAMLAVFLLFLIGFVLVCIGLLAFYIGTIYENTRHRPLYIIRKPTRTRSRL